MSLRLNNLTVSTRWVLILASGLAAGFFLIFSRQVFGLGFPLDDAWIHQTYARNLGTLGKWAFIPGQASAGSTSPLWTVLLSAGFALGLSDPRPWTFLLGIASLAGLAWCGQLLYERELGAGEKETQRLRMPWAGLFLALEYHLVWAAVSGMETDLMGLTFLLGLWLIGRKSRQWVLVGCIAGLACWIRPDGLTLLGPALFCLLLGESTWGMRLRAALNLAVGFGLFFLPYLAFNHALSGTFWPNTFYAKQAEYAVLQARPYLLRLLDELSLPLIGAGILLLPGFILCGIRGAMDQNWPRLCVWIWFLGYAGLYAWSLPVTYQYGRYLMPAMPVYFVLGLSGTAWLLERMRSRWARLLGFGWRVAIVLTLGGFLVLGAGRYGQDVAIIETEMVATARWIAANTAPTDLIAVHDIGAVGFYSQRDIVDLAGLVTPEIIPFLRDEPRLAAYLDRRGVRWLVTFPGWYDKLARAKPVVFSSAGKFSLANHGENMAVYRWK
jgi:hypothetical protein